MLFFAFRKSNPENRPRNPLKSRNPGCGARPIECHIHFFERDHSTAEHLVQVGHYLADMGLPVDRLDHNGQIARKIFGKDLRAFALAPKPAMARVTVHPASPRLRKSFNKASQSGLPLNFPCAALSDSPIKMRRSIQGSVEDRSSTFGSSSVKCSIIRVPFPPMQTRPNMRVGQGRRSN